tara:strand:- start:354 stop:728 length:375 start_codon:yes stop_codon:yes gene_type:complete
MWLSLISMAVKTGAEVYKNKKESESLESQAKKLHYEKMARGEIEWNGQIVEAQKNDWKDEFCLILISIPLLLLAYAVFSDDPDIQSKIDMFFNKFENLPFWYQGLVIGAVSAILGIRGVTALKK